MARADDAAAGAEEGQRRPQDLGADRVASAVHELRGPIGGLRSFLSLLAEGKFGVLNEKGQQFSGEALAAANRLNDLVTALLSAYRDKQAGGKRQQTRGK